jgi:hypothetical protein
MSLYELDLQFPMGGLWKRSSLQNQPPYTTPDCLNVRPDCTFGRERGGSRPGLGKAFAAELGSGNPIRMAGDISYVSGDAWVTRFFASSNGTLYLENGSAALASVSSSSTLSSANHLSVGTHLQKAFIADYDDASVVAKTDGIISGSSLTNTGATNFASSGVSAANHVVVFEGSQTAQSEQLKITINGTASAGTFTLRLARIREMELAKSGNTLGYEEITVDYDESATDFQTKLTGLLGIGSGNATVSGTGPWTITFASALANKDMVKHFGVSDYLTEEGNDLAGITANPAVRIQRLRHGGTSFPIRTVAITSVVTTTITLANYEGPDSTGGVKFRVERAPKVFDPVAGTLANWATDSAIKGSVPAGCRILVVWGDRIVVANAKYAPHAYFMCRKRDPFDWDFSQDDAEAAVAGVSGLAGQPSDPITALIPHTDDCLILGCTTSMYVMRGDPGAGGGQIDQLTNKIGVVDKGAWCHAPNPTGGVEALVFLSRDGLYAMSAECGSAPESISRQPLPEELLNIDRTAKTVLLAYDVRYRGIQIWVTDNASAAVTHFWFDWEQKSFWPQTHETDHEPTAIFSRRDNASDYSQVMVCGRDGYVRRFQHNLDQDDGEDFSSYIVYGPLKLARSQRSEGKIVELDGEPAAGSGDIDYEIRVGVTAETALNASAQASGSWNTAGLNPTHNPTAGGAFMTFKLLNGETNAGWAIESISMLLAETGRRRVS